MIYTRSDITEVVGAVNRYTTNPSGKHWKTVKGILRYIRGTLDVALYYGGLEFTIRGYGNLDFVEDFDKRKSTIDYVFTPARGAVSWVSKPQTVMTLSTKEAEYMIAT